MSFEARTCGSGEVLCAKNTFFSLLLNRTREARALCGFQHHKGENLFCFLFSDPIIVGLNSRPLRRCRGSLAFAGNKQQIQITGIGVEGEELG